MRYFINQIIGIFYSKSFKRIMIVIIGIIIIIMALFRAWNSFGKDSFEDISNEFIKIEILKGYGYDEDTYTNIDSKLSEEDRLYLDSIFSKYTKNGDYVEDLIYVIDREKNILDSISSEDISSINSVYNKYIYD